MGLRNTRLYYNTGFNPGNTPASTNLLNSCDYIDLQGHWDYQDYFLTSMKLGITWDQVKNADYLKYGNGYYWITGIKMINENNAEVYLQLDALATMGGANNLSYTQGMIRRAHPLSDGVFANELPEPVSLQETLDASDEIRIGYDAVNQVPIYVSTLSLDQEITHDENGNVVPLHGSATKYKIPLSSLDEGDAYDGVIIPNSPVPATGTTINNLRVNGLGYYKNTKGDIADQIAYLRSLGLEQSVVDCYALPADTEISISGGDENHIMSITALTYESNAQVYRDKTSRWKKSQEIANLYVVISRLSGETKTYKAHEICKASSGYLTAPVFAYSGDMNVNGKPYIWPKWFCGKNNLSTDGINGICGMSWLKLPIVANGASGSLWLKNDMYQTKAELAEQRVQIARGAAKSVGRNAGRTMNLFNQAEDESFGVQDYGPAGGLTTGAGVVGGWVSSRWDTKDANRALAQAQTKAEVDFSQATEFQLPGLSGSPVQGLQGKIANNFAVYHLSATQHDVDKLDAFFTKYGYAQDCVFDKAYLTDHWNLGYVYIMTEDIHIARTGAAANVGLAVKNMAEEELNGGIRIWYKLPA